MVEPDPTPSTPSPALVAALRAELMAVVPFAQMAPEHVDEFVTHARQAYFAPNEVVLEPGMGEVQALHFIRLGSVTGRRGMAEMSGQFEYAVGDFFPVGAVMGRRAVTATYTAHEDTFCLLLPVDALHRLAARSAPLADFLSRQVQQFLELSRRAVQVAWSSQTLAEQSLEARLGTVPGKQPLACSGDTPLGDALRQMHERRVGSVVVVDAQGAPQGILTRHDILGRVTLPQRALTLPLREVMSTPLLSLSVDHTLQDAALLMSRHGVRHVPVTDGGRLVNVVSERDLFALQRLSLKQVSTQIRSARDVPTLKLVAVQIRRFARNLLGQGVQARQLTELISHLNDVLTEHLVRLVAERRGVNLAHACWLAFGSEGRSEQTVATDQDNGLVFASERADADRAHWLAFAEEVNQALDECGYPLCKGNVMGSNPACCLTVPEWKHRFSEWIEHGAPEDLLNASIYFDLRPLAGNESLVQPLRELIQRDAARVPRFIKQMAENALRRRVPLNWRGAVETVDVEGQAMVDLKLSGTAIFVDVARLYALAYGLPELSTRARLEAVARRIGVGAQEAEGWVSGFEFLQMLRLQVQVGADADATPSAHPNQIALAALNPIDQRVLKETLRVARQLQQRMEMDYMRG